MRFSNTRHESPAFTLIELLVVIGLIGVLAAGIGIALKTNDGGTSLQGAQASLNSLISAARSQAALKNARAGVFVETTITNGIPDEGFLNRLYIAYESGQGPDGWSATGSPLRLPKGIFIVPDTSTSEPATYSAVTFVDWPTSDDAILPNGERYKKKLLSTVMRDAREIQLDQLGTKKFKPIYIFKITGGRSKRIPTDPSTAGNRIVIAPGLQTSETEIKFSNPHDVCGLDVGEYGVSVLINDARAF